MMRGFNRDTVWLATGVLGAVVFAALVLVVQEHQLERYAGRPRPLAERQPR